jgi:hypothetical protein
VRPRRLANYRQAHRRRTQLPGPSHGSCKHQIKCYDCRSATIRYQINTVGDFGHTYGGGVVNLYAFIVFDSRRYLDKSNNCANHQFTSSCERFLTNSLVGSPNPEYSYSGCTRSLHGCTHLQMKFNATIGPLSQFLSNIPSSSSTCNHFLYQSLVDELRGPFSYSAFISSRRFRYTPPAILDPPSPPFFLRQKSVTTD